MAVKRIFAAGFGWSKAIDGGTPCVASVCPARNDLAGFRCWSVRADLRLGGRDSEGVEEAAGHHDTAGVLERGRALFGFVKDGGRRGQGLPVVELGHLGDGWVGRIH